MATIRRTVFFTGRVQGVGFRYTACHVAQRFEVVGYVRNLPDGRVELVTEGESETVDAFVNALNDAMDRFITDIRQSDSQPDGTFDRFGIRY